MNFNYNQVTLAGRLVNDVELKQTPSGVSVATFALAVNRPKTKDKPEPTADFFTCIAWEKKAEYIANYGKKGSPLFVTGQIEQHHYKDKTGTDRIACEVKCTLLNLLTGKNDEADGSPVPVQPALEPLPDGEALPF